MAGAPPPRARQMADRIRVIVAEMLESKIKDPRLGFVTITEARITNDLHEATVFYTVYGSPDEQEDTAAALQSATGVIRSEIGRQTGVRFTPTLTFAPDRIPGNAKHVEELLNAARAQDARVAELATGASYAGDADPYKHDDDAAYDEDDDEETDEETDGADGARGPVGFVADSVAPDGSTRST